eukprot:Phypoly_transcript_07951.p1 GENE.Phypoly_transcript_07951~~Phypoly_transcript_07951.p1  ORF type:complete len:425 (+),score=55.73 Phypoly_transcript_07951:130-1404(+)
MGNSNGTPNQLQSKIIDCVDSKGAVDFKKLQELKDTWEIATCDIAIIGSSGCGKSTLINNLLGVHRKSRDEEARIKKELVNCAHKDRKCQHKYAPTSSRECTDAPVPYSFEKDSKVYLWDLPGYGAKLYPSIKGYWTKLEIGKYDAFLVVSRDSRVTKDDSDAILYLINNGKEDKILWIRTHFDDTMEGRDQQEETAERAEISEKYFKDMGIKRTATKLFCVGNSMQKYDINKLKNAIIQTVPEEMQFQLASRFQGYSAELIQSKFVVLQKWSVLMVLLSTGTAAGAALIPIGGALASAAVDFSIVEVFYEKVKEVYGFSSTEELIARFSLSKEMQNLVTAQIGGQASKMLSEVLVRVGTGIAISTAAEVAASIIPFVGIGISGLVSGSMMTWSCHYINTNFRNMALRVIELIDQQNARKYTVQ